MPRSSSARKRIRQSEKRRLRNRRVKSQVKTEVRKCLTAIQAGDLEAASSQYRLAARALDKAVTRGALHKGTAARRKSRLAAKVNRLQAAQATQATADS